MEGNELFKKGALAWCWCAESTVFDYCNGSKSCPIGTLTVPLLHAFYLVRSILDAYGAISICICILVTWLNILHIVACMTDQRPSIHVLSVVLYYAAGEYGAAVGRYNKALRYVKIRTYGPDDPPPLDEEQQKRAAQCEVACVLNR